MRMVRHSPSLHLSVLPAATHFCTDWPSTRVLPLLPCSSIMPFQQALNDEDKTWGDKLRDTMPLLQGVGCALAALAMPHACNNPCCRSLEGASELQLVGGRSCSCAGCRTARYCGRACQRQHWRQHKPVCQALAAAAAGTGAAAEAQA